MAFKPPKPGKAYSGETTYKLLPGEDTIPPDQVRRCKYCGGDICFLEGASGKVYAVNVPGQVSNSGNLIIRRNDFHSKTCGFNHDKRN